MHQAALVFELVSTAPILDQQALERLDANFAAALQEFEAPGSSHSMAPYGLPGRIAVAACALLRQAGMLVLGDPALVGRGPDNRLSIALPASAQTFSACRRALEWVLELANVSLQNRADTAVLAQLPALIRQFERNSLTGMNSLRFVQAAHQARIPWQQVVDNVHQFGWGRRARWLDSSFTDATGVISARLARDKLAAARLLRRALIPVPDHALAADVDSAVRLARELGWPVVVKPADQDGGRGVRVGLTSDTAVREAFAVARNFSRRVLVEKQVAGNDYRLQVYRDHVYWVAHRVPGGVTGDGRLTVQQLLDITNADPRRGEPGISKLLVRMSLDAEALGLLAEQSLTPDSVPETERFVRLRRTANVANGGVPVAVLEQTHPDNLALAVRAARALRLDLAGVDLLMPDIKRSWLETGAAICEVNAQPQLSPHLPAYVLSQLMKGEGRIPLVLLLGAWDRRDWLQRLVSTLAANGSAVGLAAPDGIEINGKRVSGPCDARQGLQALLSNPSVDAALVVVGDDQMMAIAPPIDRFDALVLLGPLAPQPDAAAWKRWRVMAGALGKRCAEVLVDRDCAEWAQASRLTSVRSVRLLSLQEILDSLTSTAIENPP